MGLFRKAAKQQENVKPVMKWLQFIEQQLDMCYKTRNYVYMKDYMIPTALAELSRQLQNYEYFEGITKHRNTAWTITCEYPDGSVDVDRVVTYNNMKIGPGLYVPVGDNYAQTWHVIVVDGKWKLRVISARSLKGWTA